MHRYRPKIHHPWLAVYPNYRAKGVAKLHPINGEFSALSRSLRMTLGREAILLLDQLVSAKPCEQGCREFANLGINVVRLLKRAAALPNVAL